MKTKIIMDNGREYVTDMTTDEILNKYFSNSNGITKAVDTVIRFQDTAIFTKHIIIIEPY